MCDGGGKEEKKWKEKIETKRPGGGVRLWHKFSAHRVQSIERKTLGGLQVQYMCPEECSGTRN